jgi:hypothetical protein
MDRSRKILSNPVDLDDGVDVIKTRRCGDERRSKDCHEPNFDRLREPSTPNKLNGSIDEDCIRNHVCCKLDRHETLSHRGAEVW